MGFFFVGLGAGLIAATIIMSLLTQSKISDLEYEIMRLKTKG
jgi:hypothetical protein